MLIEINCYSSDQSVLRCQNIRVLCGVGWFITKTNILTANFNYFVRTRRDGDHFELMYQVLITYFRKVMYKNMSMTYFTNKCYFVQSVVHFLSEDYFLEEDFLENCYFIILGWSLFCMFFSTDFYFLWKRCSNWLKYLFVYYCVYSKSCKNVHL